MVFRFASVSENNGMLNSVEGTVGKSFGAFIVRWCWT